MHSVLVLNGKAVMGGRIGLRNLNRVSLSHLSTDVVRIDRSDLIPGMRTFASPHVMIRARLSLNGTINGLHLPSDLLLTSVAQKITAPIRLIGHQTFHDVMIDKLIDGIRIPEQVVTLTRDDLAPGLVMRKGADIFSSVTAHKVDGVDLSLLNLMGVKASEGKLLNPVFAGPIFVNEMLHVTGKYFLQSASAGTCLMF